MDYRAKKEAAMPAGGCPNCGSHHLHLLGDTTFRVSTSAVTANADVRIWQCEECNIWTFEGDPNNTG
ncbi:MAG: hypothetical protein ACREP9_02205 [Candidatus Dormibacteraceae bacterium]